MTGSPNVFIKGKPAARIIDRAGCNGTLNSIAQGSSTVLINGLPAARLGDEMAHGGTISTGEKSVIIGGPPVMIVIEGNEAFHMDVQRALAKLLLTPSGKEWLRRMAKSKRPVTIIRAEEGNSCMTESSIDARNGVGAKSTIAWNPDIDVLDPDLPGPEGTPGAAVQLAHEMVHALHFAEGKDGNGPEDSYYRIDRTSRNEERSTVGLSGPVWTPEQSFDWSAPDYSKDVPTENSFRDDLGIPRRTSYYVKRTPGGRPW